MRIFDSPVLVIFRIPLSLIYLLMFEACTVHDILMPVSVPGYISAPLGKVE